MAQKSHRAVDSEILQEEISNLERRRMFSGIETSCLTTVTFAIAEIPPTAMH